MSVRATALSRVLAALDLMEIPYEIVGSLACSAHGTGRATKDVDLVADIRLDQLEEFSRHLQPEDMQFLQARTRGMKFKSVEAGAATSVFAATAPELEGRGGLYLEDCHVAAGNDAPDALDGVKSYALDPQSAERLWVVSENLVGERFALSP